MNRLPEPDAALIEGLARVVALDSEQVWLAAEQPAACGSCATRGACGSGSAKPSARWRVPRSLIPGLAVGDTLRIGVDRHALTRASLTAYALPLLLMLIAASALQDAGDAIAVVAALAGLMVGAAAAKVLVRRWQHALVPVVLGRAFATTASSCASAGTASTAALRTIDIPVIHQRSL